MPWKKVAPELEVLLVTALASYQTEKKKMFGCPAYFIRNNMFTGVHGEGIFLRLSKQAQSAFLSEFDEAALFEPMSGKIMREYVVVPDVVYNHPEILDKWLKISYDFVSALPAKTKKK